jgi:hypothetical protein
MTAPATVHSRLDYSGGAFGRPSSAFPSKAWRVQHGLFAPADLLGGAATLAGQDSIYVANLQAGLPVYAGYAYGSFDNWAALVARFEASGAKLVSISPAVETAERVACLDIEPGNATPAEAPAFQRLGRGGVTAKPVYYCSAGDAHLVSAALASAGFARSSYFLWTAHWLFREHICSPAVCGYPQADATQWASIPDFDSDVWDAAVFDVPAPPPPPADWHYGPPADLRVVSAGHTTVKLAWAAPPLDGHAVVDHFVVWVYGPDGLVDSYPRQIPGTVREWEGGGMTEGVRYTAHLSASGPGTEHLGPGVFASADFTTG